VAHTLLYVPADAQLQINPALEAELTLGTEFSRGVIDTGDVEQPALIAYWNWQATGNSLDIMRDNDATLGKDFPINSSLRLGPTFPSEIVTAASQSASFPTTNVFRNGTITTAAQAISTNLPTPTVGTSRWYRFYVNNTMPTTPDGQTHSFEDGPGAISLSSVSLHMWANPEGGYVTNPIPSGKWELHFHNRAGNSGGSQTTWYLRDLLDQNVTYRVVYEVRILSLTNFQLYPYVYSYPGNSLLYGPVDFLKLNEPTTTLADAPSLWFYNGTLQSLNALKIGINGISNGTDTVYCFLWGGVAISDAGDPGEYNAAVEDGP